MVSLVIYIISFVIIIGIVGTITVFFNNNANEINKNLGTNSEYNKFNVYMLDQTKSGAKIFKYSRESDLVQYVTFSNDEKLNTFVLQGNILYFNNIKLCENVEEFKVVVSYSQNEKQILKTYLNINGTVYTTDYVIE